MKSSLIAKAAALALPMAGIAEHQEKELTPQIVQTKMKYKFI